MSLAGTSGLSLEQAPPLHIPARFFLLAPLAGLCAGALLLHDGASLLTSPWAPRTIALTHLGTLGFLASIMWGALYQMLPVVGGKPVPALRLADVVFALLVVGVAGLEIGLLDASPVAARVGLGALCGALVAFVPPVGWTLWTAPARTVTVRGMGVALTSLVAVAALGITLGMLYAVGWVQPQRPALLQVHLALGVLGWVGVLIASVSLTIAPMFYLSPALQERGSLLALGVCGASLLALVLTAAVGSPMPLLALPAAAILWVIHPVAMLHSFTLRRRKTRDPSLDFWRVGLGTALIVASAAIATELGLHPRAGLLWGWLALVGWAGMIVHGMLYRIVPFLVWFHRFSPRVGLEPVPALRELLTPRSQWGALALHGSTVGMGALAILSLSDLAARGTGVLMLATCVALLVNLVRVLRRF